MNRKVVLLRLEAHILKDEQMIRGYRLAYHNAKLEGKRTHFITHIGKLEVSKKKKLRALEKVRESSDETYTWTKLCKEFGFKSHKE